MIWIVLAISFALVIGSISTTMKPIARAIGTRIERKSVAGVPELQREIAELRSQVVLLQNELDSVHKELDLQEERIDFAERLLEAPKDRVRIPPAR